MRIFAPHDDSGCGYYRVIVPLTELGNRGFDITLTPQGSEKNRLVNPDDFDVFVGQRVSNFEGLKFWRNLRKGHNRLVYENDDDVFALDKSNPAYAAYTRLDIREAMRAFATYSDLVTVTNETLADVYEEHAAQRPVVLPNFIRRFVLDLPQHKGGPDTGRRLRVGYMGAASHAKDIEQAAAPVRQFLRNNADWDLVIAGNDYRSVFKVPSDRVSLAGYVGVTQDERKFYENIDFDVAIAPLKDTRFSRSKSHIKALEYNARGIPVIASAVGPYKDYIRDGWNGFLVKQPHEWSKYLNLLANDHELRSLMSTRSHVVASYHTIETGNWQKWADAYGAMFK